MRTLMAVAGCVAGGLVGCAAVVVSPGCVSYQTTVTPVKTVPGLDVVVTDAGGQFWQVAVTNQTGEIVNLVWDESLYVATNGESDRIIRGKTRRIHAGQAQPVSPIAPGASLREVFVRESSVDHAGLGGGAPADPSRNARVLLVFETGGKKAVHESSILFTKR
ncbi:MAG: hypothetical protein HRU70_00790 [Phycisphaeraceae bacterium]|nr:MAG: hypothetical protein HRU70_00790 [Phycisphaeraceae bacterium]